MEVKVQAKVTVEIEVKATEPEVVYVVIDRGDGGDVTIAKRNRQDNGFRSSSRIPIFTMGTRCDMALSCGRIHARYS